MKKILAVTLVLLFSIGLISCKTPENEDIWNSATYKDDTTLGSGEKTVTVIVSGQDKSVAITLKTDESTLGDALLALEIINNNEGLFDTVIGIKADYAANQAWWKFCDSDGTALMYGVFDAEINGGESFKFVYTIGF